MKPIHTQLTQLERSGLIAIAKLLPDLEYLFRHTLVQEAAYDSLLRKDRRDLHRAVGDALEAAYADRLDEIAPQLAAHFAESGQDQQALAYYTRAAQSAARRHANAEAAQFYANAAKIAAQIGADERDLIKLHTAWGRVLELTTRYQEAYEVYSALETLRDTAAMRLAAQVGQATLLATPTPLINTPRAITLANSALALAESLGDHAAEARLNWVLMHAYYFSDEASRAMSYGERSLALCREFNLHEQLPYTISDLARSYSAVGDMARTRSGLDEAIILWREAGNLAMLGDTLIGLAEMEYNLGSYQRSRDLSAEAYQISTSTLNVWGQAHSLWAQAYSVVELGSIGQGIAMWQEAIRLAQSLGVLSIVGMTTISLAHLYDELGDPALALTMMETPLEIAQESFPFVVGYIEAVSALAALHLGDLDQAERRIKHSGEMMNRGDYSIPAPLFYTLAQAEIGMARGDASQVVSMIDEQIPILEGSGFHGHLPEILNLKAWALMVMYRDAEARSALETARQQAQETGSRRMLWSILARLADLDAREGRTQQAAQHRHEARRIVEGLAASLTQPDLRELFLSQPAVQALMTTTPA